MKSINNNIKQTFGRILPIGLILFGVMSCSVSQNTSRETDGIYYDPTTEPVNSTEEVYQTTNQVPMEQPVQIGGKYFDDQGEAPVATQTEATPSESRYEDDYVVYDNQDDYAYWGDDEGVEIEINNYYTPYSAFGFYRPFRPFGFRGYRPFFSFNFGWGYNSFYSPYYAYNPFYTGFYGPYDPFFVGYYGAYSPYYSPYGYYGANNFYGPNRFYRNEYVRNVYRGRGNTNGVRRQAVNSQRNVASHRRNAAQNEPVRRNNSRAEAQPRRRTNVSGTTHTSTESNVRIRPRTSINSSTRNDANQSDSGVRIRTPRRRSSSVNSSNVRNTPTRTSNVRTRTRRTKSSTYSTPTRSTTTNSSIRSIPSSSSSSIGTSRSSSTMSTGGRRR